MSWHFSRALVEEFWQANSSDGELSVRSRSTLSPAAFCSSDRMMAFSCLSQCGMIFAPLKPTTGEAILTWYQQDFLANRSVRPREDATMRATTGPKPAESSERCRPDGFFLKTCQKLLLPVPAAIWKASATKQGTCAFQPRPLGPSIIDRVGGLLATPTATANQTAPSMQKHPGCRRFVQICGGRITPASWEWMMGWPIGWTDLNALATDKYQPALQRHLLAYANA